MESFLSLFWLRQVANFILLIVNYVFTGSFPSRGDEVKISHFLQLPHSTVNLITGLIGTVIVLFVIFKFVPVLQRKIFILAGLTGGITGYFFWIVWFGKYLMP